MMMGMATCLFRSPLPTPPARRTSVPRLRHRNRQQLAPRCAATAEGRKTTVRSDKAGDALEVCRVVNGMWQVSGSSWGRAAPAEAVDAMLRYADGGLTTFDMADICMEAEQRREIRHSDVTHRFREHVATETVGMNTW
ncbi:hypothetical protein PR202_ga16697 [Eleusine coracana subsp. coracana]|uniref:NADP-dependent oxidoreductase domain-containing protein n=1 Tax=Eleusine coracana subsp. coracana TaxID=191504 RepID=A0AAV5CNI4_ELECO|nr:hypothetical protein PR202_ga16697 [Eleusine coracana subsp. coracana]